MMDQLTGAVCSPPEIWQMVDEMLVAQARWLPQYESAIADAKKRLASGNLIPPKDYNGLRVPTKTIDQIRQQRKR